MGALCKNPLFAGPFLRKLCGVTLTWLPGKGCPPACEVPALLTPAQDLGCAFFPAVGFLTPPDAYCTPQRLLPPATPGGDFSHKSGFPPPT